MPRRSDRSPKSRPASAAALRGFAVVAAAVMLATPLGAAVEQSVESPFQSTYEVSDADLAADRVIESVYSGTLTFRLPTALNTDATDPSFISVEVITAAQDVLRLDGRALGEVRPDHSNHFLLFLPPATEGAADGQAYELELVSRTHFRAAFHVSHYPSVTIPADAYPAHVVADFLPRHGAKVLGQARFLDLNLDAARMLQLRVSGTLVPDPLTSPLLPDAGNLAEQATDPPLPDDPARCSAAPASPGAPAPEADCASRIAEQAMPSPDATPPAPEDCDPTGGEGPGAVDPTDPLGTVFGALADPDDVADAGRTLDCVRDAADPGSPYAEELADAAEGLAHDAADPPASGLVDVAQDAVEQALHPDGPRLRHSPVRVMHVDDRGLVAHMARLELGELSVRLNHSGPGTTRLFLASDWGVHADLTVTTAPFPGTVGALTDEALRQASHTARFVDAVVDGAWGTLGQSGAPVPERPDATRIADQFADLEDRFDEVFRDAADALAPHADVPGVADDLRDVPIGGGAASGLYDALQRHVLDPFYDTAQCRDPHRLADLGQRLPGLPVPVPTAPDLCRAARDPIDQALDEGDLGPQNPFAGPQPRQPASPGPLPDVPTVWLAYSADPSAGPSGDGPPPSTRGAPLTAPTTPAGVAAFLPSYLAPGVVGRPLVQPLRIGAGLLDGAAPLAQRGGCAPADPACQVPGLLDALGEVGDSSLRAASLFVPEAVYVLFDEDASLVDPGLRPRLQEVKEALQALAPDVPIESTMVPTGALLTGTAYHVGLDGYALHWYEVRPSVRLMDLRHHHRDDLDLDGIPNHAELAWPSSLQRDLTGQSPSFPGDHALGPLDPIDPDSDGDGIADGWEWWFGRHLAVPFSGIDPLEHSDGAADPDGDGATNLEEYRFTVDYHAHDPAYLEDRTGHLLDLAARSTLSRPLVLNATHPDSDGDGLPDGYELAQRALRSEGPCVGRMGPGLGCFDPLDPADAVLDFDGDGLTNLEEHALGTAPYAVDSDLDGMPDGWEVWRGLDPRDAGDGPCTEALAAAGVTCAGPGLLLLTHGEDLAAYRADGPTGAVAKVDPDGDGLTNLGEFAWSQAFFADEVALHGPSFLRHHGLDPHLGDRDQDGLADGWEALHGMLRGCSANPALADPADPGAGGVACVHPLVPGDELQDPDRDGLLDLDEWHAATHPSLWDTDADQLPDSFEVWRGLDPWVVDAACPPGALLDAPEAPVGLLVCGALGEQVLVAPGFDAVAYASDPPAFDPDADLLTNLGEYRWSLAHAATLLPEAVPGDPLQPGLPIGGVLAAVLRHQGLDPRDADVDRDGVPDGFEVQAGHAPLDAGDAALDSDGDGLTLLAEYRNRTLPLAWDSDADDIPDGWEVWRGLAPSDASDAALDPDGDGAANVWEYRFSAAALSEALLAKGPAHLREAGLDPFHPDGDRDGLPDGYELAMRFAQGPPCYDELRGPAAGCFSPLDAADATLDFDADALRNLEEHGNGTHPLAADSDADGVPDAWEVWRGLAALDAADAASDPDADSASNLDEYLHSAAVFAAELAAGDLAVLRERGLDPHSPDSDGDTMPDGYELAHRARQGDACAVATLGAAAGCFAPLDAADAGLDTDADGLLQVEEYRNGTDPLTRDSDADGIPDGWEVWQGLDALDGADSACAPGQVYQAGLQVTCSAAGTLLEPPASVPVQGYAPGVELLPVDPDGDLATNLGEYDHSATRFAAQVASQGERFLKEAGLQAHVNDTDEDGVWDGYELWVGSDPLAEEDAASDADQDGLTLGEEFQLGTNPNDPDSDGDGIFDGWEVWWGPWDLDPLDAGDAMLDPDRDGLTSLEEFLYGQARFAAQLADDAAYLRDHGLDPRSIDADADGRPDGQDTDGDGMFDGWELRNGLEPTSFLDATRDPDRDGLTNLEEYQWSAAVYAARGIASTPDVASLLDAVRADGADLLARQADTDADGMPDGWEVWRGLAPTDASDALLDPDRDGLVNQREYAATVAVYPALVLAAPTFLRDLGLDPFDPDGDGDGMPDGWEVFHALDPLTVTDRHRDADRDGLSNIEEYQWTLAVYEAAGIATAPDVAAFYALIDALGLDISPQAADSDLDGMPDGWEVWHCHASAAQLPGNAGCGDDVACLWPADATDASLDPDRDGLSNLQEYRHSAAALGASVDEDPRLLRVLGLFPLQQDSDGDTMPDGWEVLHGLDPLLHADGNADADRDGLANAGEHAWNHPAYLAAGLDAAPDVMAFWTALRGSGQALDAQKPDSDGDAMPDGWELHHSGMPHGASAYPGLSPVVPDAASDADTDGVTNLQEYRLSFERFRAQAEASPTFLFSAGLAPRVADSDGDAMWDGWELRYGIDPFTTAHLQLDPDPDRDGLTTQEEFLYVEPALAQLAAQGFRGPALLAESEARAVALYPFQAHSDHDGLPDGWEAWYGLNPADGRDHLPDTDGDGISNGEEFRWSADRYALGIARDGYGFLHPTGPNPGLNPASPDSDGDRMRDGIELGLRQAQGCTLHATPHDGCFDPVDAADAPMDFDADGARNDDEVVGWEVQVLKRPAVKGRSAIVEHRHVTANPLMQDSDLDGILDGDELHCMGLAPANAPATCRLDPGSADTDGDSVADLVEMVEWPATVDEVEVDIDGDGYANALDTDSDGDTVYLDVQDAVAPEQAFQILDFSDGAELKMLISEPTRTDTDDDGLDDGHETYWLLAAGERAAGPLRTWDSDGDQAPDGWEASFGHSMLDGGDAGADYDGDGLSSLQEYRLTERLLASGEALPQAQGPDGLRAQLRLVLSPDQVDRLDAQEVVEAAARACSGGLFSFVQCAVRPDKSDTDRDGIPDAWEDAQGLNPSDPADASRIAPSGCSWLYDYLQSQGTVGYEKHCTEERSAADYAPPVFLTEQSRMDTSHDFRMVCSEPKKSGLLAKLFTRCIPVKETTIELTVQVYDVLSYRGYTSQGLQWLTASGAGLGDKDIRKSVSLGGSEAQHTFTFTTRQLLYQANFEVKVTTADGRWSQVHFEAYDPLSNAYLTVAQFVSKVPGAIIAAANALIDGTRAVFDSGWEAVKDLSKRIAQASVNLFKGGVTGLVQHLRDFVNGQIGKASDFERDYFRAFAHLGSLDPATTTLKEWRAAYDRVLDASGKLVWNAAGLLELLEFAKKVLNTLREVVQFFETIAEKLGLVSTEEEWVQGETQSLLLSALQDPIAGQLFQAGLGVLQEEVFPPLVEGIMNGADRGTALLRRVLDNGYETAMNLEAWVDQVGPPAAHQLNLPGAWQLLAIEGFYTAGLATTVYLADYHIGSVFQLGSVCTEATFQYTEACDALVDVQTTRVNPALMAAQGILLSAFAFISVVASLAESNNPSLGLLAFEMSTLGIAVSAMHSAVTAGIGFAFSVTMFVPTIAAHHLGTAKSLGVFKFAQELAKLPTTGPFNAKVLGAFGKLDGCCSSHYVYRSAPWQEWDTAGQHVTGLGRLVALAGVTWVQDLASEALEQLDLPSADEAEVPVYAGDFEVRRSGWTLDRVWSVRTQWDVQGRCIGATSPHRMLMFNHVEDGRCTYHKGGLRTFGTATSPRIDLSDQDCAVVRFNHWWDTEGSSPHRRSDYDILSLQVSKDDGKTWRDIGRWDDDVPKPHGWKREAVEIPGLLTSQVRLRFDFDSRDWRNNDHRGWFIDDVEVTGG